MQYVVWRPPSIHMSSKHFEVSQPEGVLVTTNELVSKGACTLVAVLTSSTFKGDVALEF
jgi:hypothetical protein